RTRVDDGAVVPERAHDHVVAARERPHATGANLITGRGADQAVGGGDYSGYAGRAAAPGRGTRVGDGAVVPQRGANHVVRVRGRHDVADNIVGRGAAQAVGGGDHSAHAGRAAAPGHRTGVRDGAVVPELARYHIVAVREDRQDTVAD